MSGARGARIAVSLVFAAHGAVMGTFASRIPWIADHLHTNPGGLGVALLFPAVGAIITMPFAGRLVHHTPARRIVPLLMVIWCLAPVPAALSPSLWLLCLSLLIYGAAAGAADVAMNAQGVTVEQAYGRSIMSSLHGMWSLGGLIGAGGGALAAYADLAAPWNFLLAGMALAVTSVMVSRSLIDAAPSAGAEPVKKPYGEDARPYGVEHDGSKRHEAEPDEKVPVFALPSRPVLLIALVGFVAIFGEGSSADWSAIYLTGVAHAAPAVGAAAYSGFAATMAVTRLLGDAVVNRFGPVNTVRVSGVAAAIGALVVALSRTPAPAIIGFALIGIGVAVVVPLAFAAAGKAGPRPGQQIAGVATIAYGAGMVAPATIGGIAHATSLSTSFLIVAGLTALIAVGAGTLRPRARPVIAAVAGRTR